MRLLETMFSDSVPVGEGSDPEREPVLFTSQADLAFPTGTLSEDIASVLRYFLGLYASVNSFTELVAESTQREEIWKRWEPLAGEQIIL